MADAAASRYRAAGTSTSSSAASITVRASSVASGGIGTCCSTATSSGCRIRKSANPRDAPSSNAIRSAEASWPRTAATSCGRSLPEPAGGDERLVGIAGVRERREQPILVDAGRPSEGLESSSGAAEVVESRPCESSEGLRLA